MAVGIIYYSTVVSSVKLLVYGQDVKEIRDQFDEINKGLVEISELPSLKS